MDPKKVVKQSFDFYKSTFNNTFNAMQMLQEQTEKTVNMYMGMMTGFPDEGKKAVNEWMKAFKKGGDQLKTTVEDNFRRVEEMFAEATKAKKE
jgi:gas vesicle protein